MQGLRGERLSRKQEQGRSEKIIEPTRKIRFECLTNVVEWLL